MSVEFVIGLLGGGLFSFGVIVALFSVCTVREYPRFYGVGYMSLAIGWVLWFFAFMVASAPHAGSIGAGL